MCFAQHSAILPQYCTLLRKEHRHAPLPPLPSRASRPVFELLDSVWHLVHHHLVHLEVDASLQQRRAHQHVHAAYASRPPSPPTLLERPHDRGAHGLGVLAVNTAAVELLLSQHRNETLDGSNAVDEDQNGRRGNRAKRLQQQVLGVTGADRTDESRGGGDDDGVNRHVWTEAALGFVHGVDAKRDRVFDAAVDEAFHGDGEGGGTQHGLCSGWREFIGDLHITSSFITHRPDLVLHLDVHRLVRLVQNEQSHAVPHAHLTHSLVQTHPLLAQQVDQSTRCAHQHVHSLVQNAVLRLRALAAPHAQNSVDEATVRCEEMLAMR